MAGNRTACSGLDDLISSVLGKSSFTFSTVFGIQTVVMMRDYNQCRHAKSVFIMLDAILTSAVFFDN